MKPLPNHRPLLETPHSGIMTLMTSTLMTSTPMTSILVAATLALTTLLGSGSLRAASLEGCNVLPPDNVWNVPVDHLPVHPSSATWIATIGASSGLKADFGSGIWPPSTGGPIGIPWIGVPGNQSRVDVTFDYWDESDPGPYPIPPTAPIEGGPSSDGDRHVLVIDRDNCVLYETFYSWPQSGGAWWTAASGAVYDLNSNQLRPDGWTSADAAGLPILPGLARYDEVAQGEIDHALRFTVPQTRKAYVWPARHYASSITSSAYPPMGIRVRLKADFDISSFSSHNQVLLRALKKYGMLLADNGSPWYISGVPSESWDNDDLHELGSIRGDDLEVVDMSGVSMHPDSGQASIVWADTWELGDVAPWSSLVP